MGLPAGKGGAYFKKKENAVRQSPASEKRERKGQGKEGFLERRWLAKKRKGAKNTAWFLSFKEGGRTLASSELGLRKKKRTEPCQRKPTINAL